MPWTLGQVRERLDHESGLVDLADELIVANSDSQRRPTRLLVIIDQIEELVTLTASAGRARLAALLRPAISGPVSVVATVRPEYLDTLLTGAELAGIPMRLFPVRPLRRQGLAEVIKGPARMAGLVVDERLVARLVDDTGSGEALPLLAYALEQLTDGMHRGGRLTEERYDQIGGVTGALTRQADTALQAAVRAGGRTEVQVLDGLLRLVTVDEHGQPTRRRIEAAHLPEAAQRELDAFVAHRLITADSDAGAAVLSVAHEAFLTRWKPLANAISVGEAALRRARDLEQAAKDWSAAGRPSGRLWERGLLAAALSDLGALTADAGKDPVELAAQRSDLSPAARDFLRFSLRRDRFRRRRVTVIASGLAVLFFFLAAGASVAAVLAFQQGQQARSQQRIATARQLVAQATNLQQTDPALAIRLGLAAQRLSPGDAETTAGLVGTLLSTRLMATLDGGGQQYRVAFSPDGSTLAAGAVDGTLRRWRISESGRPEPLGAPLSTSDGWTTPTFLPGTDLLATSGITDDVTLWDVADPAAPVEAATLTGAGDGTNLVDGLAASADGTLLATAGDTGSLAVWDLRTPDAPVLVGSPAASDNGRIRWLAFAGPSIVTGGYDGRVLVWRVDPSGPVLVGEFAADGWAGNETSVAVAPDGRTVAAGANTSVELWDVAAPDRPARILELDAVVGYVKGVEFSPDGRRLAVLTQDDRVLLWDVTDINRPRPYGQPLTGHRAFIQDVAFSADSTMLATSSVDGTVMLWNLDEQPAPLGAKLAGHSNIVQMAAFTPDGRTLATGSDDHTVRLWTVTDGGGAQPLGEPLTGHTGKVFAVAFSPDGGLLASASEDGTVGLWDVRDPAAPQPLPSLGEYEFGVYSVVFTPDGRTLATGDLGGGVTLWDLSEPEAPQRHPTLRAVNPYPDGTYPATYGLTVAADGDTLVAGFADGTVLAWGIAEPSRPTALTEEPLTLHTELVWTLALSADGRYLVTGANDHQVVLWDVSSWAAPQRVRGLTGHGSSVYWVTFAPDGRTLATASGDGTVTLWDTADLRQALPLRSPVRAHDGAIAGTGFSPDGRTLVTTSGDGTAALWDLGRIDPVRADPVATACARAGRGLTEEEWAQYVGDVAFEETCPR